MKLVLSKTFISRKTFFFTLATAINILSTTPYLQAFLVSIQIQDSNNQALAGFPLFFAGGQALTDQDGYASFNVDENFVKNGASLLITRGTNWPELGNYQTQKKLTEEIFLMPKKPYRLFELSLDQGKITMVEKKPDLQPFTARGSSCMIFPVNPNYVDNVVLTHPYCSDKCINFPSIKLSPNNKILQHKKEEWLKKNKQKNKIFLRNPRSWIRDKIFLRQPFLLGMHEIVKRRRRIVPSRAKNKKKRFVQVFRADF